jgi:DNA-binding NarL/FixJ family response regulator
MKIGIVSPYPISRRALCSWLSSLPDTSVVVELDDLVGDLETIKKSLPSLLLLYALAPSADLDAVSRVRKMLPQTKILILSDRVDEEFELRAIKAGAWGCLSKTSQPIMLEKALRSVEQGELWVSHRMASRLIEDFVRTQDKEKDPAALTRREWEVLSLAAQGYRNKEIGSRLFVSESTIKTHLYAIYQKLQVANRLEAVLYYYRYSNRGSNGLSARSATVLPQAEQEGKVLPKLNRATAG